MEQLAVAERMATGEDKAIVNKLEHVVVAEGEEVAEAEDALEAPDRDSRKE